MLALLWVSAGCSRKPKALQLTPATDGLPQQHLRETPLLERLSCPPRADCHTSRVYRDGTLYYLAEAKDAGTATRWTWIGMLSPEGVQSLERLYVSLCAEVDPVLGNDAGSDVHRVTVPGCTREFVITGIASGGLAPIEQATNIINGSMQRGVHPPAQQPR
jgi:hypothetical protein